jgi:type 1 fimbriae regulatory protein FimB
MKHLTKDELRRLLEAAKSHSDRDHLMILVAFWHGLRASEVVSLTVDNFGDGYLTVQRLKGSMKTVQQLFEHDDPLLNERAALAAYMPQIDGGESRLFPVSRKTFWEMVKRYGKAAGLPAYKSHPHVLKFTCGKLGLKGGMQIDDLRQHLGHKSLASTGYYLKSDDQEASAAFARAIGRV